jgi:uncharacterized protein (TIGR02266 family)
MPEKKQVLIICRSAAGQMYLGVLLNRIWYTPILARTPEEGIRLAQKNSFSLILVDSDMDDSELKRTVSLLTSSPALKDLSLVVFVTDDDPERSNALLAQGCSAVLTKPLDLAMVYGVLARLSGQQRSTPRIPLKIHVEIEEEVPERTLTSVNISEGGLYLRTLAPLPENTVCHVRFTLPHDTTMIKLATKVVRTLPLGTQFEVEPGMALRFIDISQDILLKIRNFVQWDMIGDLEWKSGI